MSTVKDFPLGSARQQPVAKKKGEPLRQMNVRLTEAVHSRLEETAEVLGVDPAQLARMIIHRCLPHFEQEAEQIRQSRKSQE